MSAIEAGQAKWICEAEMSEVEHAPEPFTVVATVNTKGGPGKTTLTKILVSSALASDVEVVFFDADSSRNLIRWKERSEAAGTWPDNAQGYHVETAAEIFDKLNELVKDGFDGMVFIDTAGEANEATFLIIDNADVVIVPIGLGIESIETSKETLAAVHHHLEQSPADERAVVKLVRNNIPRALTKGTQAIFDEIGEMPECIDAHIRFHNDIITWTNQGPLYTMFSDRTAHPTNQALRLNAKNTYAILDEGLKVINEVMAEV